MFERTGRGPQSDHRRDGGKAGGGKVLSFEQKSEFFYKRALNRHDSNDLPSAVHNYRIALERDPSSNEVRLALAQALSEMERFEESNRVLFRMATQESPDPEYFYALGCNFVGLNDFTHARDALEHYTEVAPEGEFIYDVCDMLDALDASDFGSEDAADGAAEGLYELSKEDDALDLADEGRELLEKELYSEAEEKLVQALKLVPELNWARNNLTLVYFCRKEFNRAAHEAQTVLEYDSANMQALCNMTMIQTAMGKKLEAEKYADRLVANDGDDPDDLNRMALVLIELGRFEDAYGVMALLKKQFPYDEGTLHRFAMCAYETDRFKEALSVYDVLLRINANDTIARYYRGICRAAAIANGASDASKKNYMLNYQVPYDEMIARIKHLNEFDEKNTAELSGLWNETPSDFYEQVCWGLTIHNDEIQRAMLTFITSMGGARAEDVLRDFLLDRESSDELKQDVFAILASWHAKEPYMAYLGGQLVESRITRNHDNISKAYLDALHTCLEKMHDCCSDRAINCALSLWEIYVRNVLEPLPRLSIAQSTALAAALEYLACCLSGETPSRMDICAKYGVSPTRFRNALKRLERK